MRNVVRLAQLALVGGVALISSGIAPPEAIAANLNAHLRGSYAFSTARTCTVTVSSVGFGGPTFAIPTTPPPTTATLFRQASSDVGIVTYNGDGTGTSSGRSRTMNIDSTTGSPLSVSEFSSTFNYTVNPDGTIDTETTSNPFTIVFGSSEGYTGTVTGQVGRGRLADGHTMIVPAPGAEPTVETLLFTRPDTSQFTQYRICVRSGTSVKLPSD
jgi:hypothetical protein